MIEQILSASAIESTWSPLAWLSIFIVAAIIVYVIRSAGKKGYKKGTEQAVAFFSGGRPPEGNIAPGNLYWGFTEALKRYYRWLMRMHTGIINDYVYSFVLLLVIVLCTLVLGGMV